MAQKILLLDLEEKLYADRDNALRIAMLERLSVMQKRLDVQRRLLNDRQRFLEIQSALQAVTAAISIMRTVYVNRQAISKSSI